jgi:hypothetical protein
MASVIARWANAPEQAALWRSRPVRGDIGIVVAPESQVYCGLATKSSELYANAARGAYRAFLANNIQADWVPLQGINEYDLLYLPYPLSLREETAQALIGWVERGGQLIAEGCPGYFDERGRAGTQQPNFGLDRLFGKLYSLEDVVQLRSLKKLKCYRWSTQKLRGAIEMLRGVMRDPNPLRQAMLIGDRNTLLAVYKTKQGEQVLLDALRAGGQQVLSLVIETIEAETWQLILSLAEEGNAHDD